VHCLMIKHLCFAAVQLWFAIRSNALDAFGQSTFMGLQLRQLQHHLLSLLLLALHTSIMLICTVQCDWCSLNFILAHLSVCRRTLLLCVQCGLCCRAAPTTRMSTRRTPSMQRRQAKPQPRV
jgi:hypothetical protein